jgi:hypothetical protein
MVTLGQYEYICYCIPNTCKLHRISFFINSLTVNEIILNVLEDGIGSVEETVYIEPPDVQG